MASLREVAQRAGVSVATASRVANGDVRVRPQTRERVERAMRDLLYVPRGRETATGLIGILVPELSNPIFPALAQAIEMRATPEGFASILCDTMSAAFREVDYVHMLVDRGVAGMIFISCEMTNLQGEHATRHLIELGHRRIGFVAGPEHYLPTRQKAAGREVALREAGLDPDDLVACGAFDVAGGRSALSELLDRSDPPTAVICSSDVMAIGALQMAFERGLSVPRDLSVVGVDGIASEWTQPLLTTIAQPIAEIADTAVDALRRLIDEPARPVPHFVFRPQLRLRGSTGAPR